jgi:hypothetical protein
MAWWVHFGLLVIAFLKFNVSCLLILFKTFVNSFALYIFVYMYSELPVIFKTSFEVFLQENIWCTW